MKYVYIAGPYTHPDPVENTHNVIEVANKISLWGFIPFVPHLNLLWHAVTPHPPEFWYKWDIEWLKKCDCLLRLPGRSSGADNEVAVAKEMGIPIFYEVLDLLRTK
jgi:nucleoside 2-deoxyribosyltransferase